jgi:uncharacterized protein YbaR (Trm112 family)
VQATVPKHNNKKTTQNQKAESKDKNHKEKSKDQPATDYDDYMLIADVSFDDIWCTFNENHKSKKLDRLSLPDPQQKHLIDSAPAPELVRPDSTNAWLQSSSLACPTCHQSLRYMLRTQGRGGWHSILNHLAAHRHCCPSDTLEDAVAGAWQKAYEASQHKKQVHETAKEIRKEKATIKDAKKATEKEMQPLHCKFCDKTFRPKDGASKKQHELACEKKHNRQVEITTIALEATSAKVKEAEIQVHVEAERLAEAQRKLKQARIQGEAIAQQRKQQQRREAKEQQRQGKHKKPTPATSYYTPTKIDEQQSGQKGLEKAERAASNMKKKLDAAKKLVEDRIEVADRVRARAEGVPTCRVPRSKSAPPSARKREVFLPAYKRSKQITPTSSMALVAKKRVTKEAGKKKISKEAKAAAARAKSEAKKERRSGSRVNHVTTIQDDSY